jgi:hypothetical protein
MWRSLGRLRGRPFGGGWERYATHPRRTRCGGRRLTARGRLVVPEVWKTGYGFVFGELSGFGASVGFAV